MYSLDAYLFSIDSRLLPLNPDKFQGLLTDLNNFEYSLSNENLIIKNFLPTFYHIKNILLNNKLKNTNKIMKKNKFNLENDDNEIQELNETIAGNEEKTKSIVLFLENIEEINEMIMPDNSSFLLSSFLPSLDLLLSSLTSSSSSTIKNPYDLPIVLVTISSNKINPSLKKYFPLTIQLKNILSSYILNNNIKEKNYYDYLLNISDKLIINDENYEEYYLNCPNTLPPSSSSSISTTTLSNTKNKKNLLTSSDSASLSKSDQIYQFIILNFLHQKNLIITKKLFLLLLDVIKKNFLSYYHIISLLDNMSILSLQQILLIDNSFDILRYFFFFLFYSFYIILFIFYL